MKQVRIQWRSTLLLAPAALLLAALSGCSSTSVRLNRDYDDPNEGALEAEAQSPEAFVERLGEPTEWKKDSGGSDPEQTAVWKCLDGKDRTVVWRLQDSQKGVRHWVVVSDTSVKGDCAGEGRS